MPVGLQLVLVRGLQDLFLATPTQGLIDYAIKASVQPFEKATLNVHIHHFELAEDNTNTATPNATTLGQEIDVFLIHKCSANTTLNVGYSHFFARNSLGTSPFSNATSFGNPGVERPDADWLYAQIDVKF